MEREFKDILRGFLLENSITQTEFAAKIGVKQGQISEWLKGKAKPGYDNLKQISKVYETSADFWLGLREDIY